MFSVLFSVHSSSSHMGTIPDVIGTFSSPDTLKLVHYVTHTFIGKRAVHLQTERHSRSLQGSKFLIERIMKFICLIYLKCNVKHRFLFGFWEYTKFNRAFQWVYGLLLSPSAVFSQFQKCYLFN